jgi:DNA-binding NarL/FixJ family response regulator
VVRSLSGFGRGAVFPQYEPLLVESTELPDVRLPMPAASAERKISFVLDEQLTEREQAAALLLAYGHTNRDVARELNVSVRTVESERARLMQKLGFARRAELVRWALERGLLH